MTIVEADSDAPMFESVCAGIRAIDTAAFAGVDTIVLQPADHPVAAQATMRALLQSHVAQPHLAIMPEHAGRGGHPVLIPLVVAREILHWNGQGGLRRFWVERPSMHRRIPVDDPLCVLDLNTPSDYQAAFTACQQRSAGF